MAQSTSTAWTDLWGADGTTQEFAFDIDGTWYGPESEVEHAVNNSLFESFGFGNAVSATLELVLFADDIPRGATIKRYVRLVSEDGETVSEWLPKGIFYINTRSVDDDLWTITAYDAMRRADTIWTPDDALEFPMTMPDAAAVLAGLMGITVDSRTELNSSYTIDYPTNDYTIRNILCYIAAAHGGNWIISDAGELYLARIYSPYDEMSAIEAFKIFADLAYGRVADSVPLGLAETAILILSSSYARLSGTILIYPVANTIAIKSEVLGRLATTLYLYPAAGVYFAQEASGRTSGVIRLYGGAGVITIAQSCVGHLASVIPMGGSGTTIFDQSGTMRQSDSQPFDGSGAIAFDQSGIVHQSDSQPFEATGQVDGPGTAQVRMTETVQMTATGSIGTAASAKTYEVGHVETGGTGQIDIAGGASAAVSGTVEAGGGNTIEIVSETTAEIHGFVYVDIGAESSIEVDSEATADTYGVEHLYAGADSTVEVIGSAAAAVSDPAAVSGSGTVELASSAALEVEDAAAWAELIDTALYIYRAYSAALDDATLTVE